MKKFEPFNKLLNIRCRDGVMTADNVRNMESKFTTLLATVSLVDDSTNAAPLKSFLIQRTRFELRISLVYKLEQ